MTRPGLAHHRNRGRRTALAGTAVLKKRPTETLPAAVVMLTSPARLCRPCRLAAAAHTAATAGFSTQEGEIWRETDCLLEGDGFELLVPRYDERSILEISSRSRGRLRPGFARDTLQDDHVPSTGKTHLHGRCPNRECDEYAGDPRTDHAGRGPGASVPAHPEEIRAKVKLRLGKRSRLNATLRTTPAGLETAGIMAAAIFVSIAASVRAARRRY